MKANNAQGNTPIKNSEFVCKKCFEAVEIDDSLQDFRAIELLRATIAEIIRQEKQFNASASDSAVELREERGTREREREREREKEREGEGDERLPDLRESLDGAESERERERERERVDDVERDEPMENGESTQPPSSGRRRASIARGATMPNLHAARSGKMTGGSLNGKLFQLFQEASDQTEIDQPLCSQCANQVWEELSKQNKAQSSANARYQEYLEILKQEERERAENFSQLESEIKLLEGEEKDLIEKLQALGDEGHALEEEAELCQQATAFVTDVEKRYWDSYNEFQSIYLNFVEERETVKRMTDRTNEQLDALKKTNLLNDAFYIWHDGHFGTINSYRLGMLPSVQVPWEEINAAWGQACLLLSAMAAQLSFKFTEYRLVYMGSNSKVVALSDPSVWHPLYAATDISNAWGFFFGPFNKGMTAYLQCMKEISDYAESTDRSVVLPYAIERDRIRDKKGGGSALSIKYQMTSLSEWTKALKFLLTNLKWLLAWIARRHSN